ncbi:hypothetical protein QVD17_39821 [Tagetes erecta]|uniref:BAH domain-containing protein n=1 Tax=Tagetes erecta TaxID=13708 RepID=A0AAD8JR67_TARER|nr:hypothetical protein QVD17_39821 [Tagetes erecta]
MEKVDENASLDFKWLKKRDVGKCKELQFYESFILYGVKYMLYDCVYMYKSLRVPYIGKLINMWECPDKTRKVEVHWFLHPEEISKWLGNTITLENEILFAIGEGLGLANINPLEAIVGLCHVVCTSKDNRNPQPSDDQLKEADYIFYRTFNVQSHAISDKMDDKVGGLEIKCIFNREKSEKLSPLLESTSVAKEENQNIFTSNDTQQLLTKSIPYKLKDHAKEPQNKDNPSLLNRNTNFTGTDESQDRPMKKINSGVKCVEPGVSRRFEKMTDMPSMKSMADKVDIRERNKRPAGSEKLYHQPLKKLKSDDKNPPQEKRVELKVAHDSKRFKEISTKKLAVDSKLRNEGKSPADVNNIKASGTYGTNQEPRNSKISAKVPSDDLEGKIFKKTRDEGSFKVPDNKMDINTHVGDSVAVCKGKSKSGTALDIIGNNKEAKVHNAGESKKEASANRLPKVSAILTDKDKENMYREFVVKRKPPRPNAESSGWFMPLPWEERLKNAYNKGTAVLLYNLDPDYSSSEVEDIIWYAFKEMCVAKILQHTPVSRPHYAQALVLLETKQAAERVLTKLDEQCLMLSNGSQIFMPLVGTPCPPISKEKNFKFFGHLAIDKPRLKNQHENEAVSTSHFPQPNTIEYDMAMEWCFLQLKSVKWWDTFYKHQGTELENLEKGLKKQCIKDS